jgi:kynurenine formamidase
MKAGKIVDLSHPLEETTPIYPGDPRPEFTVATTIKNEGYNLFNVILGSQTGSHVDAPYHFSDSGATVDKMDLRLFMGWGLIIDVSNKEANDIITVADIAKYEQKLKQVDIVLLQTNWWKKAQEEAFFSNPYLGIEAGKFLLNLGIKTVGIDAINLDKTGGASFPIHDMYAEAGGIIAENLANFGAVDFKNPFIVFLPLKLVGCDGSPVRAVAVEFV